MCQKWYIEALSDLANPIFSGFIRAEKLSKSLGCSHTYVLATGKYSAAIFDRCQPPYLTWKEPYMAARNINVVNSQSGFDTFIMFIFQLIFQILRLVYLACSLINGFIVHVYTSSDWDTPSWRLWSMTSFAIMTANCCFRMLGNTGKFYPHVFVFVNAFVFVSFLVLSTVN